MIKVDRDCCTYSYTLSAVMDILCPDSQSCPFAPKIVQKQQESTPRS